MKPFRATYTPRKWNEAGEYNGLDESKSETVLVVHIKVYDRETNADIVFIHADGKLDSDTMLCFSQCQWE